MLNYLLVNDVLMMPHGEDMRALSQLIKYNSFKKLLMISHQWTGPDNPGDSSKLQLLKEHLKDQTYSHIWIDIGCLGDKISKRSKDQFYNDLCSSLFHYSMYDTYYLNYDPEHTNRAWCLIEYIYDKGQYQIPFKGVLTTKKIYMHLLNNDFICNSDPDDLKRICSIVYNYSPGKISRFLKFISLISSITYLILSLLNDNHLSAYIVVFLLGIPSIPWTLMGYDPDVSVGWKLKIRKFGCKMMYKPLGGFLICLRRNEEYLGNINGPIPIPNKMLISNMALIIFEMIYMMIIMLLLMLGLDLKSWELFDFGMIYNNYHKMILGLSSIVLFGGLIMIIRSIKLSWNNAYL